MKELTVNKISFYIAGAFTLLVAAIMLILWLEDLQKNYYLAAGLPAVVFGIAFFSVRSLLNIFIKQKINPLYRTVHSLGKPGNHRPDTDKSKDIITEVGQEVQEWANEKRLELEQLKDMESYRKEFLGNVYHELKTPIFNLQGYILTLIEGGLEDKAINKLYLQRTEKNIDRLITIVEDLESISRLESKTLNLKIEKFNIRKTIQETLEANEMRAKKNNIRLVLERTKGTGEMVRGDKKRIIQVLSNLIVNSINYGVSGGSTKVSLSPAESRILIEITDDGIGIRKEHMPRIFERFYRVDKSRSRDSGGTGLGLSIVKHILEAHNQNINVKSSLGRGSTFTFTLDKA